MAALPYPDPTLRDDVVALRPWDAGDLLGHLMAFADPLVQARMFPLDRPYTDDDACTFFGSIERTRLAGEELSFALVDRIDRDSVLGGASLYDADLRRGAISVGYWLAAPARGRGIATRAVRLLAGWAFEVLEVERVELTCAPENAASRAVAQRAGFAYQELLPAHFSFKGTLRDSLRFERTAATARGDA